MATIETIKENIQHWNEIRNKPIGYNLLNAGLGISLLKKEFEYWNAIRLKQGIDEEAFNIHVYLGVADAKMCFYLVDSYSDAEENYEPNQAIIEKTFTGTSSSEVVLIEDGASINTSQNSISHQAAHARYLAWTTAGSQWFDATSQNQAIVQVFTIPFIDFKTIFEQEEPQNAFLFFGLTDTTSEEIPYEQQIEIMVTNQQTGETGINFDQNHPFEDVSIPYPPFAPTPGVFNLLPAH